MKNKILQARHATLALLCAFAAAHSLAASPDIQLPADTSKLRPSELAGYKVALQKCTVCHSADYISYQPPGMTQAQWTAETAKMQRVYGAALDDTQIKQVGAYLAVAYGSAKATDATVVAASTTADKAQPAATAATAATATAAAPAQAKVDVKALMGNNGCLGCHGLSNKVVGPGFNEVAQKYKGNPKAQSLIEASIANGSNGKWGGFMPPYGGLKPEELKALAAFVLQQ